MEAVAVALEDRVPPLVAASQEVQADIRYRFDTETDPQGEKWEEWSENYRPIAEAYPNIGILQRTGDLADVASSSEATIISHDTVFYQTSALPSYGLAHESGLEGLPQRSFLGLSDEASIKILGLFGEWFEGAISLYPTATGKVGARHSIRGATGFVSRSSVGRGPLEKF
jgi:hypothetical protein